MLLHRGADENFFYVTLQPPAAINSAQIPPREYVFVLDVSGSMNGFPLDTAKALMRDLLSGLRGEDSFNVRALRRRLARAVGTQRARHS